MLSLIWKHKNEYNIIDEDILLEDTFTQQTSGGENLWKTQIGVTENYLIILKCEIDVSARSSRLTSNSRIILHMAPVNQLKVNKCPRRRLKVLFPNGCKNFYKLIPSNGCGFQWARWRRIEDMCVKDTKSIPPRWVLIPFGRLEGKVQQYLSNYKFLRPIQLELSLLDLISHRKKAKITPEDDMVNATETSKIGKNKYGYYPPHLCKKNRNPKRRTRQVNRFGEGIPEGCSFGLYLSFEDLRFSSKINVVPKLSKVVLDTLGEQSVQKRALEYIHRLEQKVKEEKRKEKALIRMPIIEPSGEFDSELKNEINEEMNRTLKTASSFRIGSSPFFVSKRYRKSCSVDAVTRIDTLNHEYGYLTTNLSLPNLDEIEFCRRNHRLSYCSDFEDERTEPAISISFWISNHAQGQFRRGRFFSVNPVNQKSEANRRRIMTRNLHSPKSNVINNIVARDREAKDDIKSWTSYSTDVFTQKILGDIQNEYPICHSLWTESPTKKWKESSPVDSKKTAKENNANLGSKSKNKTWFEICKCVTDVNPHRLAIELRRIQLILFCQIENGEIARLMLKPRSVTEVNCPYLFGYLHFFERIGVMVVSELLAQCEDADMADMLRYFIQMSYHCIKMRDKQSSYAILNGLCNPIIMKYTAAWSILHQNYRNELRIFQLLLKTCWKEKDIRRINANIPVFKSFLNMVFEAFLQKSKFSSTNSLWTHFSRWFVDDQRKQNSFMNFSIRRLLSTINCQEKKLDPRGQSHYEDLITSSYGHLKEVLDVVEECRQNYCFTTQYVTFKEEIRYLLLLKQYMM